MEFGGQQPSSQKLCRDLLPARKTGSTQQYFLSGHWKDCSARAVGGEDGKEERFPLGHLLLGTRVRSQKLFWVLSGLRVCLHLGKRVPFRLQLHSDSGAL